MPTDREVWTCPDCLATIRRPPGWELPVFLSARRSMQYLHGDRHGRPFLADRRRRRTDPEPETPPDE